MRSGLEPRKPLSFSQIMFLSLQLYIPWSILLHRPPRRWRWGCSQGCEASSWWTRTAEAEAVWARASEAGLACLYPGHEGPQQPLSQRGWGRWRSHAPGTRRQPLGHSRPSWSWSWSQAWGPVVSQPQLNYLWSGHSLPSESWANRNFRLLLKNNIISNIFKSIGATCFELLMEHTVWITWA